MKTILVIEDDTDVRESLTQALDLEEYRVESACDGAEALRKLDSIGRPCLVLLDLVMPNMDGWAFLKQMRAHARAEIAESPVIVMTASGAKAAERVRAETDVQGYLAKPFDLSDLEEFMSRYCR